MVKHFKTILIAGISAIIGLVACTAETDFNDRLMDLEGRVSRLELLCSEMNTNISSLQSIVKALQSQDYITSVNEITSDGKVVGYTINFAKGNPITIYHGKDGANGHTPIIGVQQDSDGLWYWTLDGEWLLNSNGQRVKAVGIDGKDGSNGQEGKDGITPQLKIEDGCWYVSTDNGQTWTKLEKATGENGQDGKDGESIFQSVTVTDTEVTFVTANGQTFVVRRAAALSIEFDSADLVVMGTNATRNIHFTITSGVDDITIEALSSADIKVKVVNTDAKTGVLQVNTGTTIDEYSKVVVLVSNGTQAIMRSLNFEQEAIEVEENTTKEVSDEGGEVTLEFFSNIPCHAEIPDDAQSWISLAQGTKAMNQQSIGLIVQPNTGAARSALVIVQNEDGSLVLLYLIEQEPNHDYQLAIEREALIAFYNSTEGDKWRDIYGGGNIVNENWCSSLPVKYWHGVYCNNKGNVVEIGLAGANLRGSLPDELGNLTDLKRVYLQNNRITGSIPDSFSKLKQLEVLILQGNNLQGSIPAFLGSLTHLRVLDLQENYFTGTIPETFVNLKELISLNLSDNLLSGGIPSCFYNWTFWKSWWGLSLCRNLYDFNQIELPGPEFSVQTIENNQLNSMDVYSSHQYTILFQWNTKDPIDGLIQELQALDAKYGEQIKIISWANSNLNKIEEAIEYYNEKRIPGEFFYYDCSDYFYSPIGYGDESHLHNTFGTLPWYPANYATSLTIVDNSGRIVLSDLFETDIKDGHRLTEWFAGNTISDDDRYSSIDYSKDGMLTEIQHSIVSDGPNLIILGDGFSDRQQDLFDSYAKKAYMAFFSQEPYSSYKDLFNVYTINTVSKNEGYEDGNETSLSCYFAEGTSVGGNNQKCMMYAINAGIDSYSFNRTIILVLVNRDYYCGTCYLYLSGYDQHDPGHSSYGDGLSIAYCPVISNEAYFNSILSHEAGGHGFAKLADEYAYEYMGAISADEINNRKEYEAYGWWKNIDFTSDPAQVKWSQFLGDERYAGEGLGCYEGGLTYWTGVWRPTEDSIMNSGSGGFNAPSRYAIWYRICKLAYGESWEGGYEDFVAYDAVNLTPVAVQKRMSQINRRKPSKPQPMLPAPVVVGHSWREELQKSK